MAVNILLSGNNISKVQLLAKFMGLGNVRSDLCHSVERLYCFPAINDTWSSLLNDTRSKLKGKELIIAGDVLSIFSSFFRFES